MLGRQISHYKILELLKGGGMGLVYKAEDLSLDRIVAIKVVKPHAHDPEDAKQRFLREVQALSRIDHPNVVTFYEVVHDGDAMCLVMQYVDGQSLRKGLEGGRLEVDKALGLAIDVAAALEATHALGVVHRDLKPENVMVTATGTGKVLDFGIAHLADRTTITGPYKRVGTIPYMAPEQIQSGQVDGRTDVYALGVLLFEMLTGRLPYESREEIALMWEIANRPPAPLDTLRSDLPPGLSRVVAHALEKGPEHRYATAIEMRQDLETIRARTRSSDSERKLHARPRVRWGRIATGVGAVAMLAAAPLLAVHPWTASSPRIVVMPWTTPPPDSSYQGLSAGIMDCVMRSLGGRAGLSVVSRATIVPTIHALSRSFDAHSTTAADELGQEVARRLKARFLITGNIEALPMGIRVHCDLNDLRKGTLVQSWSRDLPQLDRDFYPAMESIASAVATQLGARAPGTPATTIAQQLTPSVAALRHYQAALDFLENRDVPSMIDELKKTTAIDSMFPEANLRLAQYSLGQDRRRYLGLAIAGKSVASPNTRDLIDVEDLTDRQQLDSAIVKCEQVLERDPEATAVGAQLAKLYLVKRRFRDAVAVCASVRMRSPFDYSFYPEWSFAYVEIGRSDKALGLLGDWRRQFPEEVGPIRYLVETHMNLGHYEAALSLCDTMDAIRPGSATGSRGFLMSFLGRMHDAESQFQQMASSPRPGTAAQGQKFLAMLAYQRHQYDRGMRFIRDRVGPGSSSYDLWIAGSLAAASGDVSRANEYANDIAQAFGASADTTTIEAYGDRRFYHHLRGLIALRMQHVNDATQAFERALRYAARVDGPFFSTDLAKAQMMAGHPAEAVRTLQRVIEFNPRYPEALLVLGQAYEQIGRVAEAHDVLMRLGTIWKDADSDYVLNVELRRLLHPGLAHRPSAKPYGDHPHTPDARGPSHAINDLGENALDPAERM